MCNRTITDDDNIESSVSDSSDPKLLYAVVPRRILVSSPYSELSLCRY